jgi:type I restriction enzyme M protein
MFYNTGISTYIWFVTNKKTADRKGKVQLIDATKFYQKMKKSLGNKRNELSDAQIEEITKIYAEYKHNKKVKVQIEGKEEERICCKILDNREFGYIKVTVERPLRLNFLANQERVTRLKTDELFLAYSLNKPARGKKVEGDEKLQKAITRAMESIGGELYKNREEFASLIELALEKAEIKFEAKLKKLLLGKLSEKDPTADICLDTKGNHESDPDLRDTENIPLPKDIKLPLPFGFDNETGLEELVEIVKEQCEEYLKEEVLPNVPDAWIDYSKSKIGYEIPLNRQFYEFKPPRDLKVIESEIKEIEQSIVKKMSEVVD